MDIPYFFGAAAGGFVVMAAIGIQALVALFSSIPLAKRRKTENPGFDLQRAYRRIVKVSVMVIVLVVVITVVVLSLVPTAPMLGYLFGMILAFVMSIKRMSPNNEQNQKGFEEAYADCYPPAEANPADVAAPAELDAAAEAVPAEANPDDAADPDDQAQ